MKKKGGNGGFTLIEILVVIGIIAVLAAVVLIAINPARQFAQANNSQRTANANAILNAVGQYMADNQGNLPTGITTTADEIDDALCNALVPTYMPALPTDPDSSAKGKAIADCTIADGEVDYQVQLDANARVTVCAPNTEDLGSEIIADICITR